MRWLLALALFGACGSKSDAQREADELRDRAAEDIKRLKEHLAELEKKAEGLTKRMDDIDKELARLDDELAKAIDDETRAAAVQMLDKLQLERADIERELEDLRRQVAD